MEKIKQKNSTVDAHLKEMLKDPYFREQYELKMQQTELIKPILAYRIKHNLNQKQLAEKIGVSQQHISKIESGNFSNLATLQQVLRFVGYTIRLRVARIETRATRN